MAVFKGSGVAIVTPFGQDGRVNYASFEKLIEFQLQNGTDAIVVCGTTGEASTLSDDEQLECIRFTADIVKKRVPVIAGAGSNYTEHGIYLCKESQNRGADALLLVTPYYNRCTQRGLSAHYTKMASSVDIPVILYNVPKRTGVNIEAQTVYELSKVSNITAIKEASGDISQITQIAELCGDGIDIISGDDNLVVPVMSLGALGVISVAANAAPRQVHDMTAKFFAGDIKASLKMQLEILPLVRALFCEVSPVPVKAALNLMGFETGPCRMPLVDIESGNLDKLKKAMTDYGLI